MDGQARVKMIFGQRGSGKSYLAQHLTKQHARFIVFDTLNEYAEMGVVCDTMEAFEKFFLENFEKPKFGIVYQPVNPQADFDLICEYVYRAGNMCFFVEEVDTFVSPLSVPEWMAHIIQRGRHKDITFIGVTQRPFGIPRILTSQAREIYTFKQREPRDIDYLCNFIGDEAQKAADLQQYYFLHYDDGKINISKL